MKPDDIINAPKLPPEDITCVKCGGKQSIKPAEERGGITHNEAIKIGWEHKFDGWHCPFCTGAWTKDD